MSNVSPGIRYKGTTRLYQIRDCHFSGTDPVYYIGMLLPWFCCFTSLPFHERSPMLEVEIMTQHIRVQCVLLYTGGEDVMMENVGVILLRKRFYETQKNAVTRMKVDSCVPESNVMFLICSGGGEGSLDRLLPSVSTGLSPRKRTTSQCKSEPPLLRTSKRTIYTAGRPPWYNEHGTQSKEAFVIGKKNNFLCLTFRHHKDLWPVRAPA